MKYFNPRSLILVALLTPVIQTAYAQLNCANPAYIGSGDQEYGSNIAPNETADACGTVGVGFYSLANDTASLNSAFGTNAMFSNTSGATNSSYGANSMYSNTTGANNTAFGYQALYSNSTGKGNAAQGVNALYSNTTGIRNLGIGSDALFANTIGSYNIALGYEAGYNVTTGSNNIEIGTAGTPSDNNTIQIGAQGTQTFTTIAGIYGTQITGSAVYVTSTGQLGVQGSSERFKTDIAAMPDVSQRLAQLRPVTFRYKTDPSGARQYGLIAEEVAKVYPEMVIHGADGRIDGVRYEELAPMLLNEMQRQQRINAAQAAENRDLRRQHVELQKQVAQLNDLKEELHAAIRQLRSDDRLTAGR
jgi:hypothetical protein